MSLDQLEPIRAMLLARRGEQISLENRRARFEAQATAAPLPPDVQFQPCDFFPGLWVIPPGAEPATAIIWLHGGAFVLGSPASWRHFGARVARAARMRVLLPDYRLAPEHPFPAASDDVLKVLQHMQHTGVRLAVGGDSAGANLAAAAIQSWPGARVAAVWLISPYLDLTHTGASIVTRADRDPFVDPSTMPATAATYLADANPSDPRASPLFGSVDHFPPTLVQVGSDEVLFDDARRFAERLPDAVFQEWVGMIHAWPLFPVEEGDWAIAQGAAFVRRALQG
jgi:acetyl esterase/lipase